MRINKGWKNLYKKLNKYNRQKFIEANRPFGKDPKELVVMLIWFLAIVFIVSSVLIIWR